jgi:hypothetical protein
LVAGVADDKDPMIGWFAAGCACAVSGTPLGIPPRKDLSHDEPTILLTNDRRSTAAQLIIRYAKRMLIENALADAVRSFHIDALSSSVGMKVDFDMALLVLASGLYRLMANRMRGYDDAQARQIFRDLIDKSLPPSPLRVAAPLLSSGPSCEQTPTCFIVNGPETS